MVVKEPHQQVQLVALAVAELAQVPEELEILLQ
jgi:hypothetical protein